MTHESYERAFDDLEFACADGDGHVASHIMSSIRATKKVCESALAAARKRVEELERDNANLKAVDTDYQWLIEQMPAGLDGDDTPGAIIARHVKAITADRDALRAEAERLKASLHSLHTLECPCCGEKGAIATFYEDGQKTICGCGGIVSADGESAYININDTDPCPKCDAAALRQERAT